MTAMRRPKAPAHGATLLLLAAVLAACGGEPPPPEEPEEGPPVEEPWIAPDVEERLAKFAPTRVEADLTGLTTPERATLDLLIEAARRMDAIFLRQAWEGNPELRERLERSRQAAAPAARTLLAVHYGPWDRLDEEPFLERAPRPRTAGFYPPGTTEQQIEAWLAAHPDDVPAFGSLHTVIRDKPDGLEAVPYSVAYRKWLDLAAQELRGAAKTTEDPTLARFLDLRADAFLSDDYYESDLAWMDLAGRVEVTIGPYETYEDRLLGLKAAFEAFVTVVDPEESARLDRFKGMLPDMERNLPIPDEHKNLNRGSESPIRVVDLVYAAGDTRAGVQTIAFNLPNDERVREQKGSKKVLLRNVMEAKFREILRPIAERVMVPEQAELLSAEAFFQEVLFHELSHGLGPGRITLVEEVEGGEEGETRERETEVRLELKELYSTSEEAKADVMGVYNILFLIDRGMFPAEFRPAILATYAAGLFRATRFGVAEAHGQGAALQFHYLLERGGLVPEDGGARVRADLPRLEEGIRDLVHDLCMLQALGDYDGTKALLEKHGVSSPRLERPLAQLAGIPVDIRPIYPAAGEER